MPNTLKCKECRRIWVYKTFKIKTQKGRPNNSDIMQNWFPPELSSPLFNLYKFQDSSKSTPESSRIYWNVMNDEKIGSRKILKLKYRRADQIIQTFCKIGSAQKLAPPSLIRTNFRALRKVLLNHAEYIEMEWMTKKLGLENF